jgi:hypothetical protein
MNESFDAARLHRERLDQEIDTIMTERLIQSATPSRQGPATRARAAIGRTLISLGTSLLGSSEAPSRSRATTSGGRT